MTTKVQIRLSFCLVKRGYITGILLCINLLPRSCMERYQLVMASMFLQYIYIKHINLTWFGGVNFLQKCHPTPNKKMG